MCKEKEITVLKVSPHKKPEVVTLKNELSALQEAVSSGVKDYHHLIQLVGAEEGVDLLWVSHSKIWRIEGMEGVPYGKPWRTVYTKRSAATALYLLVAAAVGGIVVLIGKI